MGEETNPLEENLKAQINRLSKTAQEGGEIRSWLKHSGFKIFQRKVEQLSKRDHQLWLHEKDADKAEDVRQEARWFFHFNELVKKLIMTGDRARNEIAKLNEENENG